jgi:hypothetical protein
MGAQQSFCARLCGGMVESTRCERRTAERLRDFATKECDPCDLMPHSAKGSSRSLRRLSLTGDAALELEVCTRGACTVRLPL